MTNMPIGQEVERGVAEFGIPIYADTKGKRASQSPAMFVLVTLGKTSTGDDRTIDGNEPKEAVLVPHSLQIEVGKITAEYCAREEKLTPKPAAQRLTKYVRLKLVV